MLYKVNGPKAMPAIPIPPKPGNYRSDPGDDKRQHEPRRRDGRFFKSMGGVNICYDWTRNENGCKTCRQPHKSIKCPQVPGWTQDSGRKGKARARKEAGPTKGLATCERMKRLLGLMGQQQSNRLWTGWHF